MLCPEVLEDRTVLSTLTVLNSLDSGPGSLRQAVLDANGAAGSDTILFAKSVHKITLTSGELAITDDLEIAGPGAKKLTISGNHASRVFDIQGGTDVSIEGLTITAGLADGNAPVYPSTGGGILNLGSLTLDEVVIDGNQAVGDPNVVISASAIFNTLGGALGGGIENFGTLQRHRQHDFQQPGAGSRQRRWFLAAIPLLPRQCPGGRPQQPWRGQH